MSSKGDEKFEREIPHVAGKMGDDECDGSAESFLSRLANGKIREFDSAPDASVDRQRPGPNAVQTVQSVSGGEFAVGNAAAKCNVECVASQQPRDSVFSRLLKSRKPVRTFERGENQREKVLVCVCVFSRCDYDREFDHEEASTRIFQFEREKLLSRWIRDFLVLLWGSKLQLLIRDLKNQLETRESTVLTDYAEKMIKSDKFVIPVSY